MCGYRINTLEQLGELANTAKSVKCSNGWRLPAAFVISMQAREVLRLMRNGMWLYLPKSHRAPIALLPWNSEPKINDMVRWGTNGHTRRGFVLGFMNELAYVTVPGGTAFIERDKIRSAQ